MISIKNNIIIAVFLICTIQSVQTQTLKVLKSPDKNKVERNVHDSVATIIIDSHVKNLTVSNDMGDDMIELKDDKNSKFFVHVDIKKDRQNEIDHSTRSFALNCPKTKEHIFTTEELFPRQVYYYSVILPDYYPLTFAAEYVYSGTAPFGVRLSLGKRYGGFISVRWNKYQKRGANISMVTQDYDVTNAQKLGYIRFAAVGGFRLGLLNNTFKNSSYGLYLMIGGGYGEYGRLWKNDFIVEDDTYFYSDYIQGFDGEITMSFYYSFLHISLGTDMLIGQGHFSVDYLLGLGICLDFNRILKK